MSDCKWTPGPWRQATGVGYCAIRTDGGVIADMRFVDRYYNPFDASLIAAAPEMAEALQALIDWFAAEDDHGKADFYERIAMCETAENLARAALAKARGEQL